MRSTISSLAATLFGLWLVMGNGARYAGPFFSDVECNRARHALAQHYRTNAFQCQYLWDKEDEPTSRKPARLKPVKPWRPVDEWDIQPTEPIED